MKKIPSEQISWEKHKFPIIVIAENIHSPSNMGMIMRICEAFGIQQLIFSGPYTNKTKKYKKSARSADQLIDVKFIPETISFLQGLKAQNYTLAALEICEDGNQLRDESFYKNKNYALIIGSERHGIDEVTLKLIDQCIHIPLYGKLGSINVSMALSIALYEMTNQIHY